MSQPNWKRPLGLAIFLVILGSVAYWSEFNRKPKKEEAEELSKKIFHFVNPTAAQQIKSIFISDGNQREIKLECMDLASGLCKPGGTAKWMLGDPIKLRADDANSNSLVATLNNLNASDTISLKEETPEKRAALLKEYGLDRATISSHKDREILVTTDNGDIGLYLGVQHPIGEGIFGAVEREPQGAPLTGKIDENTVYLIPNFIKSNFEKDLTYWRDKKLFSIVAAEVGHLELKTPGMDITGEKVGSAWNISSQGETYPGDPEAIDSLLTGATYLVAKGFVSDDKNDAKARAVLKGAKQVASLTLVRAKTPKPAPSGSPTPAADTSRERPVTLTLFQKSDGKPEKNGALHMKTYATVSSSDPLYEVESYAKDRVAKELKDLRLSKLITPMDRFGAKKLGLEGGAYTQPLSLAMKDSKWEDSFDPKDAVNAEKVQTLLDKLSSARVKDFLPIKKAPSDVMKARSGALKMTLGDDANPTKRNLEFWKVPVKGGVDLYAQDLNSPRQEIFLMDRALTEGLPWNRNAFSKASPSPTQ